jgi:photosystem II stability/assembly factor-like uncharacterized protein
MKKQSRKETGTEKSPPCFTTRLFTHSLSIHLSMKKLLLVLSALVIVFFALNFNSCTSSTTTNSVVHDTTDIFLHDTTITIIHDTIYQHYWDPEQTGVSATLIAVHFPTLQIGTAVGAAGAIVRTTDGGSTWTQQSSGLNVDLYGVSFSSPNTGIVVGSSGAVLKTIDGGQNWIQLSVDITVQFRNVQMTSATTAYAIGARYYDIDNTQGYVYKTTDGGATWNALAITAPGLYGISFVDSQTGWVSGWDGMIFKTTDGGATWTKQTSTIPNTEQVAKISFGDANHGIAVGLDAVAGVGGTPTAGFVATTSDGGAKWTRKTSMAVDGLWMTDAKHAMVVGYNGTIMETADGGGTWTTKTVGSLRLTYVFLNDPNNGATVGENGQVFILGPH